MASTSEVGHNKNAANFSAANQILNEMGALYNPTNPNIKLVNLVPIQTALTLSIKTLNQKTPIYKNTVADRETAIAPLPKLTTRTLNFARSTTISAKDKEILDSQAKKIRGDHKPKKLNPDTAEPAAISTSQQSYDSQIANFDSYINQLASHPEYIPNEDDLKIITLQNYHQTLSDLSSLVNNAGDTIITARTDRNKILYYNPTNVIQLIRDIKSYLRSLGDAGKPYYKALMKLKFRDIQK